MAPRTRDARKLAKRIYRGKDEEDLLLALPGENAPDPNARSSVVWASTRQPQKMVLPSLAECCVRSFASGFERLTKDGDVEGMIRDDIVYLPHQLLTRIWNRLLVECPQAIPFKMISHYFLHQVEVTLPGHLLPAISNAIRLFDFRFPDPSLLTSLEISSAKHVTDMAISMVLFKLPNLTKVVLRHTVAVGAETTKRLCALGPQLGFLNIGGTSIDFPSLHSIIFACRELRVLKLAKCINLLRHKKGKEAWMNMIADIKNEQPPEGVSWSDGEKLARRPLRKIETLKLRGGLPQSFNLATLYELIRLCPTLRNLDISNNVHLARGHCHDTPPPLLRLEKLNMMSVPFKTITLSIWIKATSLQLPHGPDEPPSLPPHENFNRRFSEYYVEPKRTASSLKKLYTHVQFETRTDAYFELLRGATRLESLWIHFTGEGRKKSAELTKVYLRRILGDLDERGNIQTWPLLKALTFSAHRAYDSSITKIEAGTWQDDDGLPRSTVNRMLERLDFGGIVMGRGLSIDDTWVPVIQRFKALRFLDASGCYLTTEGVMRIIDACPSINTIDVTGARKINPIKTRRMMFQLHKERAAAMQKAVDVQGERLQEFLVEINPEGMTHEEPAPTVEQDNLPSDPEDGTPAEAGPSNHRAPCHKRVRSESPEENDRPTYKKRKRASPASVEELTDTHQERLADYTFDSDEDRAGSQTPAPFNYRY